MTRRLLLVCATLSVTAFGGMLQGCNRFGCNGQAYEAKAANPLITDMKLVTQEDTDPWYTVFSVTFQAQAADLGTGSAMQYYNANSSPRTTQLTDLLQASNVADGATQGIFYLPVNFNDAIQDGDTVRLGTQLKGGGGGLSNCFELDLIFSVKPVASQMFEKSTLWASHLFDVVRRDLLKTRG